MDLLGRDAHSSLCWLNNRSLVGSEIKMTAGAVERAILLFKQRTNNGFYVAVFQNQHAVAFFGDRAGNGLLCDLRVSDSKPISNGKPNSKCRKSNSNKLSDFDVHNQAYNA